MTFPEKHMIAAKDKYANEGYPEFMFADDYWLGGENPRIEKSAHQVIGYFSRLGRLIGRRIDDILDIGAGAGNMVHQIQNAGYRCNGCEFSSSGRRLAQDRFGIELAECDLRMELPYIDNQFKWGYCVGVLSMIPPEYMGNAVREILRVVELGVLVNMSMVIGPPSGNREGNCWHLNAPGVMAMHGLFTKYGYDYTGLLPPQKTEIGIGVEDEFCGLFSKNRI